MQAILWPIISWLLREVVVKFVVFAAVFALVAFMVPYAVSYVSGFIGTSSLTGAFASLPAGVWYFLDLFRLDFGLPLALSAMVRVLSGGVARFSVGNETPVLDAVTFDQQGRPIQSVSYKPSGVIFELRPKVREGGSELAIMQQISQFVTTTTGVNNTPTLIKRELSTLVAAKDDEIILVGGLDEQRTTNNESGLTFLPSFLRHSTHDRQNTEIVLLLHVQRI